MSYQRLDVFYVELTGNVGSVQGGLRPCILIGNNISLRFSDAIMVVPLTSKLNKAKLPTHLKVKEDFLKSESVCLFEQIMTVSKQQLKDKLGTLDSTYIDAINEKIEISLGIAPAYA